MCKQICIKISGHFPSKASLTLLAISLNIPWSKATSKDLSSDLPNNILHAKSKGEKTRVHLHTIFRQDNNLGEVLATHSPKGLSHFPMHCVVKYLPLGQGSFCLGQIPSPFRIV